MVADEAYDADVIVVGAGPIGLTTACALRHHGVRTRILEKRDAVKPNSRANNIWARPQELLHGVGLREPLAEHAYRVRKLTMLLDGKPLDQVPLDRVESPFPAVLYSGQDVIEETLSSTLEGRGAPVERDREVAAVQQDDDGVTVTLAPKHEDASGPEQLRCRFLVGADGVDGTVRKALGLDFETEKLPGRASRQIDAKLHWRRSTEPDQMWFFIYHHGMAGVLPIWGGYHRMFFLEDDRQIPERDPTLKEMQAHAREITGDPTLTFTDPIWCSHTRFQHAVSPHYRCGRVFLVGDAGHFTLPIGGQGMNAGIHDAVGVAWRLAMALAGRAAPIILDSYDAERQGKHAELDVQQAKGFDRLEYRSALGDAVLDAAGTLIPNLGSRLFGGDDLQQLSVAYPGSPLSEDHMGLLDKLKRSVPRAGDRAPDAAVVTSAGKTVTLHTLLYGHAAASWGWTLLGFDGGRADGAARLRTGFAAAARWDFVRPRLVVATAGSGPEDADAVSDLDGAAHAAYGLSGTPALVLVRPDGHIALRVAADDASRLGAYCDRMFVAVA